MKISELLIEIQNQPNPHLIFLCAGNICRSPYAAMKFEDMVKKSGNTSAHKIKIQSGGFVKQEEIQIHPFTRACLLEEGIPVDRINRHVPRIMRKHKDDMRGATAMIVMTETHRDVLVAAKYRHKVLLLSQVSGDANIENIPDPALIKDIAEYRATMNIIKAYLQQFLKSIGYA